MPFLLDRIIAISRIIKIRLNCTICGSNSILLTANAEHPEFPFQLSQDDQVSSSGLLTFQISRVAKYQYSYPAKLVHMLCDVHLHRGLQYSLHFLWQFFLLCFGFHHNLLHGKFPLEFITAPYKFKGFINRKVRTFSFTQTGRQLEEETLISAPIFQEENMLGAQSEKISDATQRRNHVRSRNGAYNLKLSS